MLEDLEVQGSEEVRATERPAWMPTLHAVYLPHDVPPDLAGDAGQFNGGDGGRRCCGGGLGHDAIRSATSDQK